MSRGQSLSVKRTFALGCAGRIRDLFWRGLTITFIWGLASQAALAAGTDHNAPMKLEANSVSNNDLQGISVLVGNVRVEKGSLRLRGERIEVRQDPLGYQKALIQGANAASGRAFFRQSRDVPPGQPPEHWEGVAQKIEYDSQTAIVKLSGNAHLKRYRANVLVDEAKGASMVYDDLNDQFEIKSANPSASVPPGLHSSRQGNGRVQIILSPNP